MSTLSKIAKWIYQVESGLGEPLDAVPMTREEMEEVFSTPLVGDGSSVCGIPIDESPVGDLRRERMLTLPYLRLREVAEMNIDAQEHTACFDYGYLRKRLEARILHNTTHIDLELPMDYAWVSKLRRLLGLKPRVLRRRITARVLYPYIRIDMPHNAHSIQFYENH